MYSKCGELGMARKIFDDGMISLRDVVSWNGMIAACAHHGRAYEAITLFNEMQALGFHPHDVTYVGLLSACSHAGLVDEGLKYFNNLVRDGSIKVREDHYDCLIDLCGWAGRLVEPFDFINRLAIKLSASIWAALLAGCNIHGKYKFRGLKKQPGCSCIEVGNVVHVFVVGDNSHCQTKNILQNLHAQMKKSDSILFEDFTNSMILMVAI